MQFQCQHYDAQKHGKNAMVAPDVMLRVLAFAARRQQQVEVLSSSRARAGAGAAAARKDGAVRASGGDRLSGEQTPLNAKCSSTHAGRRSPLECPMQQAQHGGSAAPTL
jgi:hypothetical protein